MAILGVKSGTISDVDIYITGGAMHLEIELKAQKLLFALFDERLASIKTKGVKMAVSGMVKSKYSCMFCKRHQRKQAGAR